MKQQSKAGEIDKLTPHAQARRRRGQHMTAEERKVAQDAFIKALENTANVRAACMQAGVSHTIIYQWAEHDPDWSIRFNEANKAANWLLFGEAWQRALKGEERYYISRGEVVMGPDGKPATYREKSDRMLELLLKARLPEFRDKSFVDLNATVQGNLNHGITLDTRNMSPDELATLKALAKSMKERQQG